MRILAIVAVALIPSAAVAQFFPEGNGSSQWDKIPGSLFQFIGSGMTVVAVTEEHSTSAHDGEPLLTSRYYLQGNGRFVQCQETLAGGNTARLAANPNTQEKLIMPAAQYSCYALVPPHALKQDR